MSYTPNSDESAFNVLEPSIVRIDRIVEESGTARSFFFRGKIEYQPGQFIMLWIPGLDEKPFSLSYHGEDFFGVTVACRGRFTRRLHQMNVGDILGVRGPFGRPFTINKGNICIIGGGVGMATLAVLVDGLKRGIIIQGAKTGSELLYREREKFRDMTVYTEDGSVGTKGLPTDDLEALCKRFGVMTLYVCGPEPMMYKVFELARRHGLPMQASLERYMKCGIGLCGQCSCDGLRVCVDGPVLDKETLETLSDFGRFARLRDGRTVSIEEY
ncbi:MAG: dihydroorotate dehydrogenase electron transfer subunit, partial [Candidatus Brocadiales bacterium]